MAAHAKTCPESLKPLVLPYLQRATEFATRNPTVAYYCKKYAVELGAANRPPPTEDPSAMPWLLGLMDELERERDSVTTDGEEAKDIINTVALALFAKADAQERNNAVDKTTVQLFRVASVLMTATEQFGELDTDIAEKRKYARWKAAAIKRCLDQGVPYVRQEDTQEFDLDELGGGAPAGGAPTDGGYQPAPQPYEQPPPAAYHAPPPSSDNQMPWDTPAPQQQWAPQPTPAPAPPAPTHTPTSAPAPTSNSMVRNIGGFEYDPFATTIPQSAYTQQPPTPYSAPPPTAPPPSAAPAPAPAPVRTPAPQQPAASYHQPAVAQTYAAPPTSSDFEPSFESQQEAIKCAKYIISALQFNDYQSARQNARKAMELLEGHQVAPVRR